MNEKTLREAVEEANRFLRRAGQVLPVLDERRKWEEENPDKDWWLNPTKNPLNGSRESGAVRRASMDLTRALADLRRSQ